MDTIRSYLAGRIVVSVGDITTFVGDAIVDAANSALAGGGGVDGAIHRAAGPALMEECRALRSGPWPDGLPAGRAAETGAGRLPLRGVIHAVGPVWRGGGSEEAALLSSAYVNRRWDRVAFPAISTGVYGYPKAEAARIAFGAVSGFLADSVVPSVVWLVFYSRKDADAFINALDRSET
jgi:O-acetyl-ADP-ribose deacetylase (regulator of RNase III)